eukprot:Gb_01258 [translate_table: standard]
MINLICLHRKIAPKSSTGLKVNLPTGRVIYTYVCYGEPNEKLFALNSSQLRHLMLLNIPSQFCSITDQFSNTFELIFEFLLPFQPEKASSPHIPTFLYTLKRK